MTDLAVKLDATGADLELRGGDLALDHGLVPGVLVALFTDRRAPDSLDLPPEAVRGWWAETSDLDRIGSLLWLLHRTQITAAILEDARQYVREALQWLTTDRIVKGLDVDASRPRPDRVALELVLHRSTDPRWSDLWTATGELEHVLGIFDLRLLVT